MSKKCLGITKKGLPCKKNVKKDNYCPLHKDKTKEKEEKKQEKKTQQENEEPNFKVKCRGITKKGVTCSKDAAKGRLYCLMHNEETDKTNLEYHKQHTEKEKSRTFCDAKTKSGSECNKTAYGSTKYCYFHRNYNPQQERKEEQNNYNYQQYYNQDYQQYHQQYQNFYNHFNANQFNQAKPVTIHFTDEVLNKKFNLLLVDKQTKILEAIKKLELNTKAMNVEDLNRSFRRLAKDHHPDKQNGNAEIFKTLLSYKELVLSFLETL